MATAVANGVLVEKPRVSSIDLMRGIVMVVMALDHARDFYHADVLDFDPTDMEKTTPFLFFTRFITHFCAPTFVFLSGTSIRISLQRKTKREASKFLLTRGLWLILLELTICRMGIIMDFAFTLYIFQVIWAIGISMVFMSALVHLSPKTILIIGLIIIFGHNTLDGITFKPEDGAMYVVWSYLHAQAFINVGPLQLFVIYPFLAWLGVMMTGFGFGILYTKDFDPEKRRKLLIQTGLVSIALFIILRFINIYGDPAPWQTQRNAVYTFMSFLNCTKYPPSLLYILMTLGPVSLILSLMEKRNQTGLNFFLVFGRVPLFYYILHFYFLHASAILLYVARSGKSFSELQLGLPTFGIPAEGRYSLAGVYLAWICVILLLYPLCKWYNNYKSTHSQWWLSYL